MNRKNLFTRTALAAIVGTLSSYASAAAVKMLFSIVHPLMVCTASVRKPLV